MESFHVRKARAEDAPAILGCLATAFERYREQYTPSAFADTVLDSVRVQTRLLDMCVFVAIADEKLVGTIGGQTHRAEGHIRGMAVLPEWQGKGVAAALLGAVEDELRRNGCQYVTLDTTEPLMRAMRFYEKHGYRATGRIADFSACGCTNTQNHSEARRRGIDSHARLSFSHQVRPPMHAGFHQQKHN